MNGDFTILMIILKIGFSSTNKNLRIHKTYWNSGSNTTDAFTITKYTNNDCSIKNSESAYLILGTAGTEALRIKSMDYRYQ